MKSILDPSFSYVDAAHTDIRKTFARFKKEAAQIAKASDEQAARESRNKVSRLPVKVRG